MIDYKGRRHEIHLLSDLPEHILFSFDPKPPPNIGFPPPHYRFEPIPKNRYRESFRKVQHYIRSGHTYLLNLTFPSRLYLDMSLRELYARVDARFKLCYKEEFLCFSPERFVKIENDTIYTYPMKGTISSSIPDACRKILSDEKEMAEHVMVVDLLRNDLSRVANEVRVERFRYIDNIKAGERELLQVSSKISGRLEYEWQKRLGDILAKLLPAGSITGTPKKRTCEIIEEVEGYERGYFTGVFGYFDGERVDSAVMIRFIQEADGKRYYKSGGGITIDSDCDAEYREMCEKVYVPFL